MAKKRIISGFGKIPKRKLAVDMAVLEESLFQLANIIYNRSQKIYDVRSQLGLTEGQKVMIFTDKHVYVWSKEFAEGKKSLRDCASAKSPSEFNDVIQKEIIEYFNLDLDVDTVRACVLHGNNPIAGFMMVGAFTGSKKYRITIDFDSIPDAKDKENLHKLLDIHVRNLKAMVKGKAPVVIGSLKTKPKVFQQLNPIEFFDERFSVYKLHIDLQKQYGPGKVPDKKWTKLRDTVKIYYEKKYPLNWEEKMSELTPVEISKMVNEFKNAYCLYKKSRRDKA